MTAEVVTTTGAVQHPISTSRAGSAISMPAVLRLAVREARRVLLHPSYLALIGFLLLVMGVDFSVGNASVPTRKATADLLREVFLFWLPLISVFPANLIASSGRRSGAEAMLDAASMSRAARASASCLAAVMVSGVGLAGGLALWWVTNYDEPVPPVLNFGQAISVALIWCGAVALGVAIARWLPWPGMALLATAGLIFWTLSAGNSGRWIAATVPWLFSPEITEWKSVDVSQLWHCLYLAGLCSLAATAAVYRERLALMFSVGTGIGVFTALAVWMQVR
jgi:hypothetical protein